MNMLPIQKNTKLKSCFENLKKHVWKSRKRKKRKEKVRSVK
jgi:hypothetical protein